MVVSSLLCHQELRSLATSCSSWLPVWLGPSPEAVFAIVPRGLTSKRLDSAEQVEPSIGALAVAEKRGKIRQGLMKSPRLELVPRRQ